MTDADFMHAICSDRAEDTPREVYADWLDEHDRPERAEFTRVQVKLARLREQGCHEGESCSNTGPCSECGRDVEAEPLRRRERDLLHNERFEMWETFCPWALTSWTMTIHAREPRFRIGPSEGHPNDIWLTLSRGFVSEVTLTAADWLKVADPIYWHPKQTVPCGVCRGVGHVVWGGQGEKCLSCTDSRVPRPFPATAQPLERVQFTTPIDTSLPDFADGTVHTTADRTWWTFPQWPGLEFDVSPERWTAAGGLSGPIRTTHGGTGFAVDLAAFSAGLAGLPAGPRQEVVVDADTLDSMRELQRRHDERSHVQDRR